MHQSVGCMWCCRLQLGLHEAAICSRLFSRICICCTCRCVACCWASLRDSVPLAMQLVTSPCR